MTFFLANALKGPPISLPRIVNDTWTCLKQHLLDKFMSILYLYMFKAYDTYKVFSSPSLIEAIGGTRNKIKG